MRGGLHAEEVVQVLRAAVASARATGAEVTIFDPYLDPRVS
jgi:arginase family enzyme